MRNILVLVGSLRADSINKKYANALEKLAEDQFAFTYADMDLPLYNDDLWRDPPAKIAQLKDRVRTSDGILIVTPEYNRSLPAVTKNAVDWASRPYGQNAWSGTCVAITGASTGAIGTAVAQSQLRSTMVICGAAVMGEPEVYIGFKPDMLDGDGRFANEGTAKFLKSFLDAFDGFIARR
ncbi:MAG: NAD(P)H-dependent oxidoreductase [Asticcacaulis sp.]|nr:NAD(P)H-dependent oxidoreductase [Asticcacaulis sp.]